MGKLTALQVRKAGPGTYIDGRGLMLLVRHRAKDETAPPSKQWILRVQWDGERKDYGLGPYPDVELAEARELALEKRREIRRGDGHTQRKKRAEKAPTFREAAKLVHKENAPTWKNPKHAAQWLSTLEQYAFPALGDKPVDQIDGPAVRDVLAEIWLTVPETARRVRQRIAAVLDYAHGKGWRDSGAPMRAVNKALPRQPKNSGHFEAMPWADVPDFFAGIEATLKTTETTRLLLEFTILTAARTGESRGARWCEIDRKERAWNVPAERMGKTGLPHRVPLSDRALEILDRMWGLRTTDDPEALIFPGRKIGVPASDNTIRQVLRRAGLSCDPHGFRSSFRDWAAEATGFPKELAEKALSHTTKNKVEAAYQRGDLFEKRRKLMDAWSAYCCGKSGGNISRLCRTKKAS